MLIIFHYVTAKIVGVRQLHPSQLLYLTLVPHRPSELMKMPRNIISVILLALLVLLHVASGSAAHAGRPVDIGLASGALWHALAFICGERTTSALQSM